jgi:hypothetical protein
MEWIGTQRRRVGKIQSTKYKTQDDRADEGAAGGLTQASKSRMEGVRGVFFGLIWFDLV